MSPRRIRSVLIVDDSPNDVYIARFMLAESGRFDHIASAADGEQALEMIEQWRVADRAAALMPPRLVLLDINMPRLGGFGVLERLAELGPGKLPALEVVMLTSSDFGPDRDRAAAFELVRDYLVKPLDEAMACTLADRFGR